MTKYIPHIPSPYIPPAAEKTRLDRIIEAVGTAAAWGCLACVALLALTMLV